LLNRSEKVLIARKGGNKAGNYLEETTFGLGGQKGLFLSQRAMKDGDGLNFPTS
jgi:hypothetical protein